MSYMQPRIKSFKCGSDLSAKQFTFVKFGSDDETIVPCTVADEKSIGVLMNAPDFSVGEFAEVALPGGGAKLKASGVIPRGSYISSAVTSGQAKVAAPGSGLHSHVGAIAHATSATNDIISVELVAFDLIG